MKFHFVTVGVDALEIEIVDTANISTKCIDLNLLYEYKKKAENQDQNNSKSNTKKI